MAKNSISPKLARSIQSKVDSYIKELDSYMTSLAKEVETLNRDYWYGGGNANDWYNKMSQHYINAYNANQRLKNMNDTFKRQITKYQNASDSK